MHNKCLGVFLVFITIPLIILAIINLGVGKLTTAKYYEDLFKKTNSYNTSIQTFKKTPAENDFLKALQTNISAAWLQTNLTQNLDQFDAYFNGNSNAVDPSIDIRPFKKDLTAGLPVEVKTLVPDIISFKTYTDYLTQTQKIMSQGTALGLGLDPSNSSQIKQQISSTQDNEQKLLSNFASAKRGYALMLIFRYVIFGLAILMLAVIALAARHWYPAIFRWTGQTLLISGVLSFILFFFTDKILVGLNLMNKIDLSNELKQIITPIYNSVLQDVASGIEKISLIIAGIGLIFLIVSYILPIFAPEAKKVLAPQKTV